MVHRPRRVVVTGGPGAGKTAALEVVARSSCPHVVVLPEAASIVYGGGFPRRDGPPLRRAAQRAIFHVQDELERAFVEGGKNAVVLCDRGLLDGLAYWPDPPSEFFEQLQCTRESLLARYAAVIHLRTPAAQHGYNHRNPLRTESAEEAAGIDERILAAWAGHPHRVVVESTDDFLAKVQQVVALVREELPRCCLQGVAA
jgi:predicted ATPase